MAITLIIIAIILLSFLLAIHIGFRAPRRKEQGSPADYDLPYQEVRLTGPQGKRLFAWWLPTADSTLTVIMLHGWGGNAELMLPLAVPVHHAGINVMLLDARNHGRSDAASFSSLPRFAEDVGVAIDWVRKQDASDQVRVALLGHSVGAGAVLLEASRRKDISAVVSIAAFAHPEWMMHRYLQRFGLPNTVIKMTNSYVQWVIGYRFEDIAPLNTIREVSCPVLLIHGTEDQTVSISDAQAIHNSCGDCNNELLFVEGADHDSTDKIEQHSMQLISFLKRSFAHN